MAGRGVVILHGHAPMESSWPGVTAHGSKSELSYGGGSYATNLLPKRNALKTPKDLFLNEVADNQTKQTTSMTQTSLHPVSPTVQTTVLALMFSSRTLLTEKSSASDNQFALAATTETLTLRATRVTPILQEIQGYSHFGINE